MEPTTYTEAALRGASIFWFLFSTGGVVSALLAAVAWVLIRPKSHAARLGLAAVALGYTLVSIYAVPHAVEHWIGAPFHPLTHADVPSDRSVVVLLGSGNYRRLDWSDLKSSILDPIGLERTLEAARVYRLIQPDFVISSGGLIEPDIGEDPVGDTMKDTLVRLGVPADRVIVERESTNTRDEALLVKGMLPSLHVQHVVLVTSAIHMRRAVGMFRAVGVETIPAIARQPDYVEPLRRYLPSDQGLRTSGLVVHELAGLTYYWLKGWYKSG
jgi:uncharacterized SAM-binding protein YcdF (DUF218 family)